MLDSHGFNRARTSSCAIEACLIQLFVHSEEIPPAIKPYRDFQKEKKLDSNNFTGVIFEKKFYDLGDFKRLETMPTRVKIYVKLFGMLNSPASSLVGMIQAPAMELIMLLKAYV
ncbi:hypothetical protein C1H46_006234 [Malus baccata]|uniref:Uncharacterized protein n=1 Tax=Malus baccata TaxID=106549 RepID=A0A540NAQ3_MALBA|nr:hypothetical protein C1H46_006234 [Malus baccata]